jgi:hypothetical protein
LEVFDEIDSRAHIDSSFAADDTVGEDSEVLIVLVEEDDDPLLSLEVGGHEDGEVWFIFFPVERKTDLGKT